MNIRMAMLAALACIVLPLGAEVRVLSVEIQPELYVSGQAVLVRIAWDDQGTAWEPAVLAFDGGGESLEPTVLEARLARRAGRAVLELVVVPWRPGPSSVPPMELAGLSFPSVELDTASALDGLSSFMPTLREQREPPGLRTSLYLAAAGGLTLCVLLLGLVRYLPPRLRLNAARGELKAARRKLIKVLDTLAGLRRAASLEDWRDLCSALRAYVSAALKRPIQALTPSELDELAAESPVFAASAAILRDGDRARFALDATASLERALLRSRELVRGLDQSQSERAGRGRAHVV